MAVSTLVGKGNLYLTAHPERNDVILEEFEGTEDSCIWLVLRDYYVNDNAVEMYLDDLSTALYFWRSDNEPN